MHGCVSMDHLDKDSPEFQYLVQTAANLEEMYGNFFHRGGSCKFTSQTDRAVI